MSTYIQIHGVQIPILSADPSTLQNGDMWYNTTSNSLKCRKGGATVTVTIG